MFQGTRTREPASGQAGEPASVHSGAQRPSLGGGPRGAHPAPPRRSGHRRCPRPAPPSRLTAPRPGGPAVRGSRPPSKMVVIGLRTVAAHGTPPHTARLGRLRRPPRPPLPPVPGGPGPLARRSLRALGRAGGSRQPPPHRAPAAATTWGAGERNTEGVGAGGSPRENATGTPRSPPFCFPPFSRHPKPPTATTTGSCFPRGVGSWGGGGGRRRRPSLRNLSPASAGGGGRSRGSGGSGDARGLDATSIVPFALPETLGGSLSPRGNTPSVAAPPLPSCSSGVSLPVTAAAGPPPPPTLPAAAPPEAALSTATGGGSRGPGRSGRPGFRGSAARANHELLCV